MAGRFHKVSRRLETMLETGPAAICLPIATEATLPLLTCLKKYDDWTD